MPKLYEIADAIERVLAEHVDPETGEITPEASDELDRLEMDREQVALHIARYLKGERLEAAAVKAEADKLTKRFRSHENRAKWLERYLAQHCEGCSYSDATSRIRWAQTPGRVEYASHAAESCPEEHVDPRFVQKRVEIVLDKTGAGEALRAGEDVKGLRLVREQRIRID